MEDILKQAEKRRAESKRRWDNMNEDLCMLCHAYGADKRNVFIQCGYEMQEAVPEFIDLHDCGHEVWQHGYYLRVCKNCRGAMLASLREWANRQRGLRRLAKDHDGYLGDSDYLIPARIDGVAVWMEPHKYREHIARKGKGWIEWLLGR